MKEVIGIAAAALVVVAYVPYLRDILRGKTKPHPYSWFVWTFITALIFALQRSYGSGPGSYVSITVTVISVIVCILALKNGMKQITVLDTVFFVLALVATGLWLIVDQPTLSMVLLVSIDMLGLMPTVRKAWHKPYEETLSMWEVNSLRHALSIFAIQKYSLLTLLNPLAWAISNALFSLMLIARRKK